MGVKISELPEATSVQESDIMPIVQEGVTKKVEMSKVGGNEVFIGDIEEAPDTAKLVIDDDGVPMFSSEVVNSLSGDETAKAPSVHAVNDRFTYSTTEQRIGTWIDGKPLYRKVIIYTQAITKNTDFIIDTISNIDTMLPPEIDIRSSSQTIWFGDVNYKFIFSANLITGAIYLSNDEDWSSPKLIVILKYTKTTDSAS